MINFTNSEIFLSIGYATIWGVAYSALYSLLLLLRALVYSGADIVLSMLRFEKILPIPSFNAFIKIGKTGPIFAFFSVIIFALGIMITSYFALDGVIRIYTLIVTFAAFYLSKFAFFDFLIKILIWIFDKMLQFLCMVFRFFITPFKMIFK